VIFIDSNVPVYLVGAPHQNRELAFAALDRLARSGERMVTSAEVMQELLHLYAHRRAPEAMQRALDVLRGLADEVYAIEAEDVERAHAVLRANAEFSARDALHVAVMQRRLHLDRQGFALGPDRLAAKHRAVFESQDCRLRHIHPRIFIARILKAGRARAGPVPLFTRQNPRHRWPQGLESRPIRSGHRLKTTVY
jgi:predicted nucleic acid-binding protein